MNACHSEELARIFLNEVGAEYAVAVESQEKIEDQVAQTFAYYFYSNLVKGNTVPEAFHSAKNVTRQDLGTERSGCCCNHSHAPDCLFLALQGEYGEKTAHDLLHNPPRNCSKCPKKQGGIHKVSCCWARDTLRRINRAYAQVDDDYFAGLEEIRICCCLSQESYQQHEETYKFKLLENEQSKPDTRLLLREEAEFEDETSPELDSCRQAAGYLIGRNLEIERMASHLCRGTGQHQVVILTGVPGAGKSATALRACEYMIERGGFPNGLVYLQFEECTTENSFICKITEPL